jgi:hypothetical protein
MRQQRHTTAYAPSWQPSGDRTAPHGHSSEKKAPTFQPGRPNLTDATSISRASYGKGRRKHKHCRRPTAGLSITPLPSPFAAQGA